MPFTSLAFLFGALSLVGIPGTAGFISKWLLVEASFSSGNYFLGFCIVLSSLLTFVYLWIVIDNLFFKEKNCDYQKVSIPLSGIVPLWVFALSCVFFGIFTDLTLVTSDLASSMLFNK